VKTQLGILGLVIATSLGSFGCAGELDDSAEGAVDSVEAAEVGVGGEFTIFADALRAAGGVAGQVESSAFGHTTTSDLSIRRAPANKNWGAIAHVDRCSENQGGARYRNDPNAGSTAQNEIWLDVRTDAHGRGTGHSVVNFVVRPQGAKSLVLYQNPAASGNVGARIACIDFPWDQAD